jgi:hypothetical protein
MRGAARSMPKCLFHFDRRAKFIFINSKLRAIFSAPSKERAEAERARGSYALK